MKLGVSVLVKFIDAVRSIAVPPPRGWNCNCQRKLTIGVKIGAQFTTHDGTLDLGREGGHTVNRIVHASDLTGREIERALLNAVGSNPAITMFENHVAVELITEHHLSGRTAENGSAIHAWGVYALNSLEQRVDVFLAPAVLLSAGFLKHRNAERGEFYGLLLFASAGMSLLALSAEFITLFVNLEVLSVATEAIQMSTPELFTNDVTRPRMPTSPA